jgi:hypothetical protein
VSVDPIDIQRIVRMLNDLEAPFGEAEILRRLERRMAADIRTRETFREITGWTLVRRRERWVARRPAAPRKSKEPPR